MGQDLGDTSQLTVRELHEKIRAMSAEVIGLRNVLDNIPGDIYWKDSQGRYLGFNKHGIATLRAMGFATSKDDVIGKTDCQIFGEVTGGVYKKHDDQVLSSKQVMQCEENVEPPSAPARCQLTVKSPLFNQDNDVVGLVGNTMDITYTKEIELQLRQAKELAERANQEKTIFMRNMQHDIRTPFTGILGLAQYLFESETNPDRKDILASIVECSVQLLDYCNGVLDFSKVKYGVFESLTRQFDLRKLLASVIAIEKPAALCKGLEVREDYQEDLPNDVVGDDFRLYRILLNLLSNAIKFTKEGFVTIRVRVACEGGRDIVLSMAVIDSGEGIPQDKQAYVFEPFTRLTESNRGVQSGMGLGLSVVKQFVGEMKGEIDLASIKSQGTTVECVLPLRLPTDGACH